MVIAGFVYYCCDFSLIWVVFCCIWVFRWAIDCCVIVELVVGVWCLLSNLGLLCVVCI